MKNDLCQVKGSVLRHLKKHASDGRSIRQRKQRNNIHAENAEIYNQAVCELAREGLVELHNDGPHGAKFIRLSLEDELLE